MATKLGRLTKLVGVCEVVTQTKFSIPKRHDDEWNNSPFCDSYVLVYAGKHVHFS